jgi:hypothetical protein
VIYEPFDQRPEFAALASTHNTEVQKVELQRGIFKATAFGRQFAQAVIFPAPDPETIQVETTLSEQSHETNAADG